MYFGFLIEQAKNTIEWSEIPGRSAVPTILTQLGLLTRIRSKSFADVSVTRVGSVTTCLKSKGSIMLLVKNLAAQDSVSNISMLKSPNTKVLS